MRDLGDMFAKLIEFSSLFVVESMTGLLIRLVV